MSEPERKRIIVRGRVQGVGYRLFALRWAQRLGVRGTVRNLPDGRSVEVVAEAEAALMAAFLGELRKGPPGGHVGEMEVEDIGEDGTFGAFEVVF